MAAAPAARLKKRVEEGVPLSSSGGQQLDGTQFLLTAWPPPPSHNQQPFPKLTRVVLAPCKLLFQQHCLFQQLAGTGALARAAHRQRACGSERRPVDVSDRGDTVQAQCHSHQQLPDRPPARPSPPLPNPHLPRCAAPSNAQG